MNLVPNTDKILRTVCDEFDFAAPPFDPIEYAQELMKFMYDHGGLGLAANQVGTPFRIFAMRGSPQNFVCYNPKIVMPSDELVSLVEGCLSWPGLVVEIKRPKHVRVRFNTPNGDVKTELFTGMTARVFTQELEHLDGGVFYKLANSIHRERALKNLKLYERKMKREKAAA